MNGGATLRCKKTLRICVTVYTQYRRVTDGRTDRQTDGETFLPRHSPHYAYASRGKNLFSPYFIYFFVFNAV